MNRYLIIALRAGDRVVFPALVKGLSVSGARTAFLAAQDTLCKILSVTQVPEKCEVHMAEEKNNE